MGPLTSPELTRHIFDVVYKLIRHLIGELTRVEAKITVALCDHHVTPADPMTTTREQRGTCCQQNVAFCALALSGKI